MAGDPVVQPTAAFFAAPSAVEDLVDAPQVAGCWDSPSAVEGFSVGALTGHLSSAIRLFEWSLGQPGGPYERIGGLADFYGLNRLERPSDIHAPLHTAIRSHAASVARQGPGVVTEKSCSLVARLEARLAGEPMSRLVPVWRIEGGPTHLSDYLLTRIVELVVHGDDLAQSTRAPFEVPDDAATAVFAVMIELARSRSGDLAGIDLFLQSPCCPMGQPRLVADDTLARRAGPTNRRRAQLRVLASRNRSGLAR